MAELPPATLRPLINKTKRAKYWPSRTPARQKKREKRGSAALRTSAHLLSARPIRLLASSQDIDASKMIGPLDPLRCTGFEFPDHLVHVLPGCYPSKVIYKGEAFDFFDSLPPTLSAQRCVLRKGSATRVSPVVRLLPRGGSAGHCLPLA